MEKAIVQYDIKHILISVLVGILVVLLVLILNLMFSLSLVKNLIMGWIFTTAYSVFAFFTIDNREIRQIETERIVEKPIEVVRRIFVPIDRPVDRIVTQTVDRPVIQEVIKEVVKEVPVYIREPVKKRLNIPKYNYIASSETRKYHKRTCKFGKLIKNKYKIHNDEASFFKRNHFKACKACLKTV